MFELVRTPVEELPGYEQWSLKQLENPLASGENNASEMEVAVSWETFGSFRIGKYILDVTKQHTFDTSSDGIGFSMSLQGIFGGSVVYNNILGQLFFLIGELGSTEGRIYPIPTPKGAPEAFFKWVEELSENTYWDS